MRTFSFITILSLALAPALANPASAAGVMPSCAAGDRVVWENTSSKSKAYHVRGDRYFGTTKHGAYACQSDAEKAGYHAAKMRAGKMAGSAGNADDATDTTTPAMGATAAPAAMTSPSATTGKHHHRKHHPKANASPANASPDPSAT